MSLVLWAKAIYGAPDCHTDLLIEALRIELKHLFCRHSPSFESSLKQ
jgi:hypothetical protein